jgi:hypothetical protein
MDPIKDLIKVFEQDAERARADKEDYWRHRMLDENGDIRIEFAAELFAKATRRDPRSAQFLRKMFLVQFDADAFSDALRQYEEREHYK